jgi:hypothetical protein
MYHVTEESNAFIFCPEDGVSQFLGNVSSFLSPDYTGCQFAEVCYLRTCAIEVPCCRNFVFVHSCMLFTCERTVHCLQCLQLLYCIY